MRIDPATHAVETFFSKKHGHSKQGESHTHKRDGQGQAKQEGEQSSSHGGGHANEESMGAGPRRLLDVRFAPDDKALYIADFGSMIVENKPRPAPGTGVIWRIVPESSHSIDPPAGLSVPQ